MEMTNPYSCMLHIYGLMIGYTVLLVSIILYFNLWKNKGGMIGGIIYSGFGFLMTPNVIAGILHQRQAQIELPRNAQRRKDVVGLVGVGL